MNRSKRKFSDAVIIYVNFEEKKPAIFNSFLANVPFTDKPDSLHLLAKCLKNTCGSDILSKDVFLKHFAFSNMNSVYANCKWLVKCP